MYLRRTKNVPIFGPPVSCDCNVAAHEKVSYTYMIRMIR